MQWSEIQQAYPNQWLVIESLEAKTAPDNRRQLKRIAVVERCPDSQAALHSYRHLHQQHPLREFYFVHTSRAQLDIREQSWVGIRRLVFHLFELETGRALKETNAAEFMLASEAELSRDWSKPEEDAAWANL